MPSFIWTSHPTPSATLPTPPHTTTGSLRSMDRRNLINTPDKNQISHIASNQEFFLSPIKNYFALMNTELSKYEELSNMKNNE